MKDNAGSVRKKAMVMSWLTAVTVTMLLLTLLAFMFEGGHVERMYQKQYLLCATVGFLGSCAWWMKFGWFRVAEGELRFLEYGGMGNPLQRVHFRDGRVWQLTTPLHVRLRTEPGRRVVIEENFFTDTRVATLIIEDPWSEDGDDHGW